jgi:hypothetical protein
LPSGTQIGVEDERIRPGRRHEPHEFLDDGQTLPMGGVVGHPGPGLVDDHDIGVGRVAQLAPAEASHPDDEHVDEQPVLAPTDDPGRDLQGGLDGRSGKVGESSPDLVRGELTGEIAEGRSAAVRAAAAPRPRPSALSGLSLRQPRCATSIARDS